MTFLVALGDKGPDKTIDSNCASGSSVGSAGQSNSSSSSSCYNQSCTTTQGYSDPAQPEGSGSCPSASESEASSHTSTTTTSKTTTSPRELPPRSQLIQLKPVMSNRPKLNNRNSLDSSSDAVNKQK